MYKHLTLAFVVTALLVVGIFTAFNFGQKTRNTRQVTLPTPSPVVDKRLPNFYTSKQFNVTFQSPKDSNITEDTKQIIVDTLIKKDRSDQTYKVIINPIKYTKNSSTPTREVISDNTRQQSFLIEIIPYDPQDSSVIQGQAWTVFDMVRSTFVINAKNSALQTYQNEKYGFQIDYPYNWKLTSTSSNPFDVISLSDNQNSTNGIFVQVFENPQQLTLSDYWKKQIANSDMEISDPFRNPTLQNISVDNSVAIRYISAGAIAIDEVNMAKGKYVYKIALGLRGENAEDSIKKDAYGREIFDQILSSFKFVGSNATVWKSFKYEKFGVEFQIPAEHAYKEKVLNADDNNSLITIDVYRNTLDLKTAENWTNILPYVAYYSVQFYDPQSPLLVDGMDVDKKSIRKITIGQNLWTSFTENSHGTWKIYELNNNTHHLVFLTAQTEVDFTDILKTFKFTN